jgi:hypothetical protein
MPAIGLVRYPCQPSNALMRATACMQPTITLVNPEQVLPSDLQARDLHITSAASLQQLQKAGE